MTRPTAMSELQPALASEARDDAWPQLLITKLLKPGGRSLVAPKQP